MLAFLNALAKVVACTTIEASIEAVVALIQNGCQILWACLVFHGELHALTTRHTPFLAVDLGPSTAVSGSAVNGDLSSQAVADEETFESERQLHQVFLFIAKKPTAFRDLSWGWPHAGA